MACEKRPYLCGILILGTLALFFHLVGFVTPGWLIMRLSLLEESRETTIFQAKLIEHGHGSVVPEEDETAADLMKKLRRRRSEQEIEVVEEAVVKENEMLDEWIIQTTVCIHFCISFLPVSPVQVIISSTMFIYCDVFISWLVTGQSFRKLLSSVNFLKHWIYKCQEENKLKLNSKFEVSI